MNILKIFKKRKEVTDTSNKKEETISTRSPKIELSKDILDSLSVYDVIYAEYAEGGAMGSCGQIMFYIIKEEKLICYVADLFKDEKTHAQTGAFLLSHQNESGTNNIFNYYYGGFGNHVYVNKDISLTIVDEHFVYNKNNEEYHIHCSCLGVFNFLTGV